MAPSHDGHHDDDDDESHASPQAGDTASASPGLWTSVWENNKGALLILISELFGSSMDAMARFLQQGGRAFPVLQVGSCEPLPPCSQCSVLAR